MTDPTKLLRIAEKLIVFERPLLVTLPRGQTARLGRIAEHRSAPSGSVILAAGAKPTKVFLLINGEAVIRVPGLKMAVKRVRPGQILGIPESFGRTAAAYDLVAVSDCRVGVLTGARLERFFTLEQEARSRLIDSLGRGTQELYRFARVAHE